MGHPLNSRRLSLFYIGFHVLLAAAHVYLEFKHRRAVTNPVTPKNYMARPETILVTGATGYIGGRLVPRLIREGRQVRVLVRSRTRALSRSWSDQVEVVAGDALNPQTLSEALAGVDTAYYLIHSMSKGGDFHELDIQAARAFGEAAAKAGVNHIIYLGGLGVADANLSPAPALPPGDGAGTARRRRERHRVPGRHRGRDGQHLLRDDPLPGGAAARNGVPEVGLLPGPAHRRRRPPRIPGRRARHPESRGLTIEIGGKDATTYRGMMLGYAEARGLRRLLIPVPVLTPRLSSYWVHWFTPIPASITVALVEGLRNDVVVTDDRARSLFPNVQPKDYASAIGDVLEDLDDGRIDTSWSDTAGATSDLTGPVRLESRHGMIIERRRRRVAASAGTSTGHSPASARNAVGISPTGYGDCAE